jgi:hypothetical protein
MTRRKSRSAVRRAATAASGALRGDVLACVLSFCSPKELLTTLPRVSRTFRRCIANVPRAWPPTLDLTALRVSPQAILACPAPWSAVQDPQEVS